MTREGQCIAWTELIEVYLTRSNLSRNIYEKQQAEQKNSIEKGGWNFKEIGKEGKDRCKITLDVINTILQKKRCFLTKEDMIA